VRRLVTALDWGQLAASFSFSDGLLPLLFRWRLAAAKVVPFRTAASRLEESGGKPPHSKRRTE